MLRFWVHTYECYHLGDSQNFRTFNWPRPGELNELRDVLSMRQFVHAICRMLDSLSNDLDLTLSD